MLARLVSAQASLEHAAVSLYVCLCPYLLMNIHGTGSAVVIWYISSIHVALDLDPSTAKQHMNQLPPKSFS